MSLKALKASLSYWRRAEKWAKSRHTAAVEANDLDRVKKWGARLRKCRYWVARRKREIAAKEKVSFRITTNGGARGIVDQAYAIARRVGGSSIYVASAFRPGDRVGSGSPSDHSGNDRHRAARDIAKSGTNVFTGPPSAELDRAVVAIGKAFGRNYGTGRSGAFQNADTFIWRGYRVQIIWRTPRWGGHNGHIHIGVLDV